MGEGTDFSRRNRIFKASLNPYNMQRFFIIILSGIAGLLCAQEPVPITLEDIYLDNRFREKTVTGLRSMNDGVHYTVSDRDMVIRYSYKTGLPVE